MGHPDKGRRPPEEESQPFARLLYHASPGPPVRRRLWTASQNALLTFASTFSASGVKERIVVALRVADGLMAQGDVALAAQFG